MSKRAGAYKSEKRKKEVMRQKKQEAKRHKRVSGPGREDEGSGTPETAESSEAAGQEPLCEPVTGSAETKE